MVADEARGTWLWRVAQAGGRILWESCGRGAEGVGVAVAAVALGPRPLPMLPIAVAVTSAGRAYRSSGSLLGVLFLPIRRCSHE